MLLATTLQPRLDGTVIAEGVARPGHERKSYTFQASEQHGGALVADVTEKADLAHFLTRGWFEPVEPGDFKQASGLVSAAVAGTSDSDDDADEVVQGGAPVESNTQPKPAADKPHKAKKAAAAAE